MTRLLPGVYRVPAQPRIRKASTSPDQICTLSAHINCTAMAWGRAIGLYGLAFLPATWAITFPGSEPTATAHGVLQPDIPEPTPAVNLRRRGLLRRDDEDDFASSFIAAESTLFDFPSAITTTTSWLPQSVCGYIDGIWDQCRSDGVSISNLNLNEVLLLRCS